jgi:hypothetical protein
MQQVPPRRDLDSLAGAPLMTSSSSLARYTQGAHLGYVDFAAHRLRHATEVHAGAPMRPCTAIRSIFGVGEQRTARGELVASATGDGKGRRLRLRRKGEARNNPRQHRRGLFRLYLSLQPGNPSGS